MDPNNPTGGAPGINQPGAAATSGPGAAHDANDKANQTGDVGILKFHLSCAYHADLPEQETEEAAHTAAAAHLKSHHADAGGVVAKNAEVLITAIKHFTSEDAAKVKPAAKP
jgi:hypothetical protein